MLVLALILTAVQPVRPLVVQRPSPTGHLAYAKGVLSPPMTGELPSAALRFVDSKRAELGLSATDGVSVEQAMSSRFGATVQLGQRVHGLEVAEHDLQGVAGAVRRGVLRGADLLPPNVHFELAAEILSASVGQAFKNDPMAEAKMKAIFDARGVSNCSKVLDVTELNPKRRDVYIIPGADFTQVTAGEAIPGPYQMKFRVPNGARSVTVSGPYFGGGGGGSTPPTLLLLAKANAPVTFVRTGTNTTHDADRSVVPTRPVQGQMSATAMIDVPCGGELYFTVANTSRRDRQLTNLAFSYEPALECPPPVPDAGSAPVDAGPSEPAPIFVPGVSADLGAPLPAGCGCSSAGPGLLALVGLGALRRRRR